MAGKDIIMASPKELRRLRVLHEALEDNVQYFSHKRAMAASHLVK